PPKFRQSIRTAWPKCCWCHCENAFANSRRMPSTWGVTMISVGASPAGVDSAFLPYIARSRKGVTRTTKNRMTKTYLRTRRMIAGVGGTSKVLARRSHPLGRRAVRLPDDFKRARRMGHGLFGPDEVAPEEHQQRADNPEGRHEVPVMIPVLLDDAP